MKIKKIDLMEIATTLRQIKKIGKPDLFFILYTAISVLSRIYLNSELLKHFNIIETIIMAFVFSILITLIAIKVSSYLKLDWYAREKDNLIFLIIGRFYKGENKNILLRVLFFIDSFLFSIYSKNGNKIKAFGFFLLSLLFISIIWGILGFYVNWKFILLGVIFIVLIIKIIISMLKRVMYK